MSYQPFWFDKALDEEKATVLSPKLSQNHHTDICIIGGGYTGLWTAIQIKQQQPTKKVTVIEQGLCGQGASGRNGGAMLTWSTKLPSLINLVGIENALFLVKESERAVHSIKQFAEQNAIDCDCRIDGCFYTASNQNQVGLLSNALTTLDKYNLNAWHQCSSQELKSTGSIQNLAAYYSIHGGSIQPAKLVRGLKKVAQKLGVNVIEQCKYESHGGNQPLTVQTSQGPLLCSTLIFGVNAWLPSLHKAFSRSVVLVSSDMIITKPIPSLLEQLNLNHGSAVIDSRIFVNYYRTTSDGRLMLGKGGNFFSFNNHMHARFDMPSKYDNILQSSLSHFFKGCDFPIERTWTGPSDRSVTGFPFFGHLNGQRNVLYSGGYSGNGIVQSFLGAKILSAMALKNNLQWQNCGLVNQQLKQFPQEPIRTAGAYLVRNAIRRKEFAEDCNATVRSIDKFLARFSGSAGKVDTKTAS
ncbi:FAD-dependent oxidoreductase [Pseudoalteromonas sp. SR44-5]|nr:MULTISPECIES: FAD-dependent oxidoreductase [unclassified Pseudoalteromonas]MBB1333224.1 FAD-dependent oxidoreductase [Pseudoalteromonas sp. SR41-6]MBB1367375.1 FAD-dependent oxidoreductase [Pseudoalteromonas sp. SR44-5]MBB1458924.1 FAD-dependent oxidoreductase [Pseudoalteromonas sp. SG41-8]MBB1468936.1 FAD-dependent oxidoreductase [Pseudoalteromonas sp. SG41-5]